jgi:predicted transposase YbfD/YdcC
MLDAIDIQGKNITTDALLTQRKIATPITISPLKTINRDFSKTSPCTLPSDKNPIL